MKVYPKITRNAFSLQNIFILGCGCDVKNPVQPCRFIDNVESEYQKFYKVHEFYFFRNRRPAEKKHFQW